MRIPFCPIPLKKAIPLSKKFYGVSAPFVRISPKLKIYLEQAEMKIDERTYMGIAFFSALFMFFVTFIPIFLISLIFVELIRGLTLSFLFSFFMFFVTLFYIRTYPKVLVKKKVRGIERNIVQVLRHLYVQVKSGVTIFDAMISVSNAEYGVASTEFRKIINEVNAGVSIEKSLDEIAVNNPSLYFRRVIWQISNGIKAGSDIATVLKSIIDQFSSEQKIEIRKYGSKLNPMTLVYMMVAIVIPSLGVTFLIVLSSFSGISIGPGMFWGILVFLIIFQFMFLGIIKSKRPNIL